MPGGRLTPLDATFLSLEDGTTAHMHIAGICLFEGPAPAYSELIAAVERRLHLVPRYRQRLNFAPFGLNHPEWVDDPFFTLDYHVRLTALPRPGTEEQLKKLAGRILSQRLDRERPLWEMWLIEKIEGDRWALISKSHHALVDGISGVDIGTVLFDLERTPADKGSRPHPWHAEPLPSTAGSVVRAVTDRVSAQALAGRTAAELIRRPDELRAAIANAAGAVLSSVRPGPPSIYNVHIGPHRRFTWVRSSLADVKAIKNALGGTVNDVVLTAVGGAVGRHMRRRGERVGGVELVAMVPVSVRAEVERGALGNRVSSYFAPLPVGVTDPVKRLRRVSGAMRGLKESGNAVGAEILTQLGGLAPVTILDQASRLVAGSRVFNLTITNVPGPQLPLYMAGRQLLDVFPMVPLAPDHALGIAIISYNGTLDFGLVGDYDAMADVEDLAVDLAESLEELAVAAGVRGGDAATSRRGRRRAPASPSPAKRSDDGARGNGRTRATGGARRGAGGG
jgi:WS/DGAT/MGAT family acyltransferase